MNRILAIYDKDILYSCRLAEYLRMKDGFPFQIALFTQEESLKEFAGNHTITILLVSSGLYQGELLELPVESMILLAECSVEDGLGNEASETIPCIYKYQAVTGFLCDMMKYYRESQGKSSLQEEDKVSRRVIGIYSPLGAFHGKQIMKALIEEKYVEGHPLVISLELFSDYASEEKTDRYDLSDGYIFWKLRQLSKNRVEELIQRGEQLDWMRPVSFPEDLFQIQHDDIGAFLEEMIRLTEYKTVIIDFDIFGGDGSLMSRCCTEELLPYDSERGADSKLERYLGYLEYAGLEDWKKKISFVRIDREGQNILEITSSVGDEYGRG